MFSCSNLSTFHLLYTSDCLVTRTEMCRSCCYLILTLSMLCAYLLCGWFWADSVRSYWDIYFPDFERTCDTRFDSVGKSEVLRMPVLIISLWQFISWDVLILWCMIKFCKIPIFTFSWEMMKIQVLCCLECECNVALCDFVRFRFYGVLCYKPSRLCQFISPCIRTHLNTYADIIHFLLNFCDWICHNLDVMSHVN